jgi:hypothetical protein
LPEPPPTRDTGPYVMIEGGGVKNEQTNVNGPEGDVPRTTSRPAGKLAAFSVTTSVTSVLKLKVSTTKPT